MGRNKKATESPGSHFVGSSAALRRALGVVLVFAAAGGCSKEPAYDGAPAGQPTSERAPGARAPDERELLEGLGYVNVVPVPEEALGRVGVTHYDPARSAGGLNLFNLRDEVTAHLMTMDGRQVHRWQSDATGRVLDELQRRLPSHVPEWMLGWNLPEWLPDGDLLVIGSHHMLLRLDWDSRIEWKVDLSAHHDLSVSRDGRIFVLTDGIRTTPIDGETVAFQDNFIVELTPDGEVVRELSLYHALLEELGEPMRQRIAAIVPAREERLQALRKAAREGGAEDRTLLELYERASGGNLPEADVGLMNVLFHGEAEDVFHTNSLQVLEADAPGLWRAGDLMVVVRAIDSILVIDHESGRSVWRWGAGQLQMPHHATCLPDGNVLVFDNGAYRRYSRIVKMNPRSREIVWQYQADPPSAFFSETRGGCEELSNGNYLITETNTGRAFEITPQGEIVWEFYGDFVPGASGQAKRSAIYRMMRVPASAVEDAAALRDL